MDVAAILVGVALIAGGLCYAWGRARSLHELKYQRRMAEQWYVAYRREQRKRSEDPADWWKD